MKSTIILTFLALFFLASCSDDKHSETSNVNQPNTAKTVSEPNTAANPVDSVKGKSSDGNCSSILERSCLDCHTMSRTCQKLGKKDKKRWERTIDRMIKRGSKLSSADKDALVDCLVDQSPDIVQMCQ